MGRKILAAVFVVIGMGVPAAASAQAPIRQEALPPETAVVSPGGVDMVTGRYRYNGKDLSIGSPESGGLSYERIDVPSVTGRGIKKASNWYAAIQRKQIYGRDTSGTRVLDREIYSVVNQGLSSAFEKYPSQPFFTFTGLSIQGAVKLESAGSGYTFTAADGTITNFGSVQNSVAVANSVVKPDGTTYTLTWSGNNPAFLVRVASSAGYQLILEYSGDSVSKACVFNTAFVSPPGSNYCPAGAQTVTYGYDGNARLSSITYPDSSTATIATTGVGTGTETEAYYKPGQSQPWLTNTLGSQSGTWGYVVTNQTMGDGRTLSYTYEDYAQPVDGQIAGGGTSRSTGWTENGAAHTGLGWGVRQQLTYPDNPGPIFISPAPETITDPLSRLTTNAFSGAPYTAFERLMSRVLPDNRQETFTYANVGLATRTAIPSTTANGEVSQQTSFTYSGCFTGPSCAKPVTATDPKTNVADYTYDPTHGGVLTETLPAAPNGIRPQKRYAYSQHYTAGGTYVWLLDTIKECRTQTSCAGTADEVVTTFGYGSGSGSNGVLPLSKTVAAGDGSLSATTSWTYDANGDKLTEDGPAAGAADTTRWRYDAMRRTVGVVTPNPGYGNPPLATRNTYDAVGRLTKIEKGTVTDQSDGAWANFAASEAVQTDYDIMDRKTVEKKVAGGTTYTLTQYSYDSFGRLECSAVRMNPATFGSLPSSACTLGAQGGQGPDRITRNTYDLAGQLLKVQKAYGTALQQDYVTYTYTVSGKQEYVTDAGGNKTRMVYDGHDRLKQWQFPSASSAGVVNTADYEQYGYDANGNRTSFRKRDGRSLTYSYDNLNRMTVKTVPDGIVPSWATRDVYYGYDNRGLQIAVTFDYLGGEGITFGYDALGRKLTETSTMGGVSRTLTSSYDISGTRTRLTWPDGQYVNYYRDGLERLYYTDLNSATPLFYPPYDAQGRVSVLHRWVGGWTVPTTYGYDLISRPVSLAHGIAGGGFTTTLTYNPANQIVTRTRDNDAYSWNGYVVVNRGYATNGLNQYTSAGGASFGYDANGNLTGDGTNSYTYDVENRLVLTGAGAAVNYDPLGRMWHSYSPSLGVTRYLYDGDQLVAEYDANGNQLARYVHADGEDDPLVWYAGAGTTSPKYLYADQQGSIVAIADASGSIAAINAYDEYGIPKATNQGRFQYTGQAWLPELGMYYYKARFYSPTLGRFMQTDPIGYADQINLYAYVGNDPVTGRDPTGLFSDNDPDRKGVEPNSSSRVGGKGSSGSYGLDPTGISLGIPTNAAAGAPRPAPGQGTELNRRRRVHDQVTAEIAAGMEERGGTVTREVTFQYNGKTARFDIVASANGVPVGVTEVKTVLNGVMDPGDLLRRNQPSVAAGLRNGQAIPIGPNAAAAGFVVNRPIGRPIDFTVVPVVVE